MITRDILTWISAGAAALAAALWFLSASVQIPAKFPINVTSVDVTSDVPMATRRLYSGWSDDIDELGRALITQSRLSAAAASLVGISAMAQAIALALH